MKASTVLDHIESGRGAARLETHRDKTHDLKLAMMQELITSRTPLL